ncbi:cuticle protein 10.9 [Rhipicephalus microplus]|uniref:cuticle protein 10.9 n=1 Tax=Rhipicephalus microplus TaxID=6941 RepID=UPI0018899BA4|nr:cuticle protein 10.9-like [Rhipicephalus microplus]
MSAATPTCAAAAFLVKLLGLSLIVCACAQDPVDPPQPYSFGFENVDEYGTQLYHKEQGDASNAKKGSYGYRDAAGLFRRVEYVADLNGYRATVDTNEPGTAPGQTGDTLFNANPIVVPISKSASAPVPAFAPKPAGAGSIQLPWTI